ncbi:MAG: polysaccharide biosynthesis/export family protein [Acidobacteriota bacterium]|nr:polysaccharide biosynthesis/export family protein [Acidobacteriota bacterium]
MPDGSSIQNEAPRQTKARSRADVSRHSSSTSLRELWEVLRRRRRLVFYVEGGVLLLCLLYCLIAPNQYEASAEVALRTAPASSLNLDPSTPQLSAAALSSPAVLETLANVFRSDELAWRVIAGLKLYQAPAFRGSFARRFPGFRAEAPSADAQAFLLERFQQRLNVRVLPRTLLIQIRFRSRDAALSAEVVNALIRAYGERDAESRVQATEQASAWLDGQLKELKERVDRDRQRLNAYESAHGLLSTPETLGNGQHQEAEHNSSLLEIDELSRQLVAATTGRILREAEYRAASKGDPELVLDSDPPPQAGDNRSATALLEKIHARRSDLEQEQAQLTAEDGPNFPRVVEIGRQLKDLDRQKQDEDARLVEQFRGAWQTAVVREQMVRKSLEAETGEAMRLNEAATQYALMQQEASASNELYTQVLEKVEEAGLAAGVPGSSISVVDEARPPAKPVAPNLPLYMAIAFFAGLWLAVAAALLAESLDASAARAAVGLLAVAAACSLAHAQAPTPNNSGLPMGVAGFPQSTERKSIPNPKEAPTVWNGPEGASHAGLPPLATPQSASPMPVAIGPGDLLEVSEYHTPEFRSLVRVSPEGAVTLPMIGEVRLNGLDEQAAAHAIEAALKAKGILLHPLVSVLVTAYAGEDVSILGEVARPGIYPYTVHHRLLDMISEASGLAPDAGRLVNVYHRDDPKTPHAVVLDPDGSAKGSDHNPELSPGDTVEVSRAGLVYVIGDVIRPGGFPIDSGHGLTAIQALSLAWGPTQNAALGKALLIREQKGGRTMTALNLSRLLRGQDPDLPVRDGDILFVPDSAAKNLWNRTMESVVQSAVGVTIYSGLVYSQRY